MENEISKETIWNDLNCTWDKLGEVLEYEQPQKYLVKEFHETGRYPVLTANKSFILGFTNSENLYLDYPTIIFDDFTVNCKYVDFKFAVKSSAIKFLKAKERYDLRYIFYQMKNIRFSNLDHKRYYLSEFRHLSIPIPSLPEQKAIATCLSDIDDLIASLQSLVTKKKQILKATMKALLSGKKRLDGFIGEWEENTLGEVFDFLKGSKLSKSILDDNGTNKCILYGELFTTYRETIRNIASKTNSSDGVKSQKGDILMPASTTTTGLDLVIASSLPFDDVLLGGDINIFRSKIDINSEYFAFYLTNAMNNEIVKKTQGITIIHLYGKSLKDITIPVPPLPEQEAIATILSDMDLEIEGIEQRLHKTRQVKDGMMQKLLTGEIRLPIDDKSYEPQANYSMAAEPPSPY